jgi:Na+/proline symporter
LWALKSNRDQAKFITYSFAFGMLLPAITCGGIMARVLLGYALFADGMNPNQAIPELFIATMPSWIAALFGAGVGNKSRRHSAGVSLRSSYRLEHA